MPRKRDYAKEYQRRINRGLARGYSRAKARGHASAPDLLRGASKLVLFDPKLEAALKALRRTGEPLTKVAREAGIGRERLSRYIKSVAGASRTGRKWVFNDQRIRKLAIIEAGAEEPSVIKVRGYEAAHLAGLHAYEAGQVLQDQSLYPAFVRRWEGIRVRDANGKWRTLSTDLNQLYRAILAQDYSFERFYSIIH